MHTHLRPDRRTSRPAALMAAMAVLLAMPASALGWDTPPPTPEPSYITLEVGVTGSVTPIINSGQPYHGVTFEGIPDGIGIAPRVGALADVYVTHEQSRVPFRPTGRPTLERDYVDSSVTRWTIDPASGAIIDAGVAIPDSAGFIRFCSAFMAGPAEGFSTYTFFANEESDDDLAVPANATYGPDPALAPKREAGYTVALDTTSGVFRPLSRMGRHNHENAVVVPGDWNKVAILSGDDTFAAPSSQLYLFTANNEEAVRNDHGQLWAFQVTGTAGGPLADSYDPFNGANDYGDISVGETFSGRFIHVPTDIARGLTGVAPQKALEDWSNANNVFQFIRVEDIAYDRNDPTVVYFADTGERRATPDAATGRLRRGPNLNADETQFRGPYPNGRIFRMDLNERDPRVVDSLSIVLDADLGGYNNTAVMHQPDNLDTSETTLMVQEDSSQAPNSRIWRYDLATGAWSVVAHVNDPDWESSGIVDASEWFGVDTWMLDVQAHNAFVRSETELGGTVLVKQEKGQLLLMEIEGTAPNG